MLASNSRLKLFSCLSFHTLLDLVCENKNDNYFTEVVPGVLWGAVCNLCVFDFFLLFQP
jgi:hypothetical protein